MPKLLYLPLQGRAQAIRYMLNAKGVHFDDERLSFEEWGAIKAAGTYGTSQLPIWVGDDGKWYNQSVAILRMLAAEHGYAPTTASAIFESEWFLATTVDTLEKPERMAFMKDDATEEAKQAAITCFTNFLERCNAHWADGRTHVAGNDVTEADFALLSLITGQIENPHSKHADIREATIAKLAQCEHVVRVVQPMRDLCAAQIASLQPAWI